jgi:cell division protein FtsZ
VTVIAAGFEGGEPKKISKPVISTEELNGQANPIPANDPIAVAMGTEEKPRRRITFQELVSEDEVDIPDFMK